ncbi:hypothetical protein ACMYR2_1003 [Nitrobacter sp. TKz-YC01]
MPRHEFKLSVKRELAIRAAHFCSNPHCLRLTSGPRSGGERGLGTGHAAHICAAAEGGPRYDPGQSESERRSSANGLWLCRECGDMVDKDSGGFRAEQLRNWKRDHEIMIREVRQHGWSSSIELLRSGQMAPGLAREIIALFEDRRTFWATFDAEFPDRVRMSLENLRHGLTRLRRDCAAGSPLDTVIVALGQTIRHFFDAVERFDLSTLRCDGRDPDWLAFESALRAIRKSVGYQVSALGDSYGMPLQGEFAAFLPQMSGVDGH